MSDKRNETRGAKAMLSLQEAADKLGISRTTAWRLVRAKELQANRIGRVWRVPAEAIAEYLRRTSNRPPAEDEQRPN